MVEISLSVKQQCDQNKKRPKFPQIFATIVFTRIFFAYYDKCKSIDSYFSLTMVDLLFSLT